MELIDRTVPPDYQPITEFSLQRAETHFLDNGLPVHVINAGTQEIVRLEIIIWYAKWNEKKDGASLFVSKLLLEGTRSKSSSEISDEIDKFGAYIEITPGSDFTIISLYTIHKFLDPLLKLLSEILNEPTFPDTELQKIKTIEHQHLKINLKKNSYLAATYLRAKLFGETHPYGRDLKFTTIDNITRNDLLSFYKNLKGARQELILSGLITPGIINNINRVIGIQQISPASFEQEHQIISDSNPIRKPRKDAVQTSIRIGKVTIKKGSPDYHKLLITNELLGGFFGSRLMKNIREDKGFTYGIYSRILSLSRGGYFTIGADVKKQNTEQAIDEIFKELKILRTIHPSEVELETVKNYMRGSFQSEINTPFALADKFKAVHLYGLDYSYYHHLFSTIRDITPSDILSTAEKYLHEDSMTVVAVG